MTNLENVLLSVTDSIGFHIEDMYNHNEKPLTKEDIMQVINAVTKEENITLTQKEVTQIIKEGFQEYNTLLKIIK